MFDPVMSKYIDMKKTLFLLLMTIPVLLSYSGSAPSTYFNLYVPPNNDPVNRNVALIVTAIQDSTSFSITDDGDDGDTDDSVSGLLMAGQSYVLYIKDNGINDDAATASGGQLTRDGDYFIVNSDKLVYTSMSTDSDWQHDFVSSVNKKSVGEKFIVYAPKITGSLRDLNVFAYEDNTSVTISKISNSSTTSTGYTDVDINNKTIVVQKTINRGQDLIHYFPEGRNIMNTGETYMIECNKGASVQYGALYQNSRDGGAYVPSSNGSSSGELFYFAVPYQSGGEQEIRVVSWDDNNSVVLERYLNGSWVTMKQWSLDRFEPKDWVGKQNGNSTFPTVFRITCSSGKKVSVFEANWMETGSTNTSDMATMVSSESGTASGKDFLVYMLPPSKQTNVINPFTGDYFDGSISHLYLFAGSENTVVTIKDAKTDGQVLNRTYNIDAGKYADAFFTVEEWKSIYNGTGTPSGDERPYVLIESTENISVVTANPNDNWMMYFGSSLPHSFNIDGTISQQSAIPGDTIVSYSNITVEGNNTVINTSASVIVGSGGIPFESTFINETSNDSIQGVITFGENHSEIEFDSLPDLNSTDDYIIQNKLIISSSYNNGQPIEPGTVIIVETILTGEVDGETQQTILAQGIENGSDNTTNLNFNSCGSGPLVNTNTDSWNGSWIDYNGDGWEDLYVTNREENLPNQLFENNGDGSFSLINNSSLSNYKAKTVSNIWADINNDGNIDALIINATGKRSSLFINNGDGTFSESMTSGIEPDPEYFHGAAFADFDNDGYVDLIITNFFPTKFHQLYKNNGDNTFELITNTPVTMESERAMAPILSDYNNDGLVDIFIPNGNDSPNSLFKNIGSFQFEKITVGAIVNDAKNSVGAVWGDFDNDNDMDLFVANASGQNNDLYANNGDGTFIKLSSAIISQEGGHSHSATMMDLDNDGDLDIFVSNDQGPNFYYTNNGDGTFSRKLDELIASDFGNSYGVSWADYNKTGFMDAVVATHSNDNNKLFCNNGNANNWLNVRLTGTSSNRSALGAKVGVKSSLGWQYKEVLPVSGFGGQNSIRTHFGLGSSNSIDSISIIWPSGNRQHVTSGVNINTFITIIEEESNILNGVTFNDKNQNGVKDENEETIGGIKINISPSNHSLSSNTIGGFHIRLADGDYTLSLPDLIHWTSPGNTSFQLSPSNDSIYLEIPLYADETGHDLKVDFATTAWRRGFTNNTVIQAINLGTEKVYNVSVILDYPEEGTIVSSEKDFIEITDNSFEWIIDSLSPGENIGFLAIDSIFLSASTGQMLSLTANISADGIELEPSNNTNTQEIEVVGAIDPNDILVSPKGERAEGYISKEQWLTYTIRFQNVGTYYATMVNIENQIPEYLNLNSFEVVSSSHSYNYNIDEKGVLSIQYLGINLPDSTTNEEESHGYFKYTIHPQEELMGQERIVNQASIVFDFEEAIVTNTVLNTIKYSKNDVYKLIVYPNPAIDETSIAIDLEYFKFNYSPRIVSYSVVSIESGQTYLSEEVSTNEVIIALDNIPSGYYLLYAIDEEGNIHTGKLIKP